MTLASVNITDAANILVATGFLGLAFLLLRQGGGLLATVVQGGQPVQNCESIIRFYLVISLIFMVLAGPLQYALIYINQRNPALNVTLEIADSYVWDETKYGQIQAKSKGIVGHISKKKAISFEVREGDVISIVLGDIRQKIDRAALQLSEEVGRRAVEEDKDVTKGG